jgi:PadR family transcriptional regulator, regulatory protein PadR
MTRSRRPSAQTLAVLTALGDRPRDWLYGLELAAATGLKSGSLYPILIRLADRGWLESQWLEPQRQGRPPRHAYRITAAGRAALSEATKAAPAARPILKGSPA